MPGFGCPGATTREKGPQQPGAPCFPPTGTVPQPGLKDLTGCPGAAGEGGTCPAEVPQPGRDGKTSGLAVGHVHPRGIHPLYSSVPGQLVPSGKDPRLRAAALKWADQVTSRRSEVRLPRLKLRSDVSLGPRDQAGDISATCPHPPSPSCLPVSPGPAAQSQPRVTMEPQVSSPSLELQAPNMASCLWNLHPLCMSALLPSGRAPCEHSRTWGRGTGSPEKPG